MEYRIKESFVKHIPGHKNSKGEASPYCIVSHETGKILSSHKTESAAKKHLQDMHAHGNTHNDNTDKFSNVKDLKSLLNSNK